MATPRPRALKPSQLASRYAEARAVESTYHLALAYLGATAYVEALAIWQDVPPSPSHAGKAALRASVQIANLVRIRRRWAREITLAYTRLARALYTGHTIDIGPRSPVEVKPQPTGEETRRHNIEVFGEEVDSEPATDVDAPAPASPRRAEVIGVDKLRKEFVEVIEEYAPQVLGDKVTLPDTTDDGVPAQEAQGFDGGKYEPYDPDGYDDDDVLLEELDGLDDLLSDEEARAEAEMDEWLDKLAEQRVALDIERAAKKAAADEAMRKANEVTGRMIAGQADRLVQNGGRHTEFDVGSADHRVAAWARVHQPEHDGAPCGFCAILISRGAVYKSAKKAGGDGETVKDREMDAYHTGCHCRATPLYAGVRQVNDPRFAANEAFRLLYEAKWQSKVETLSTDKDAKNELLRQWGRYIDDLRRRFNESGESDLVTFVESEARSLGK